MCSGRRRSKHPLDHSRRPRPALQLDAGATAPPPAPGWPSLPAAPQPAREPPRAATCTRKSDDASACPSRRATVDRRPQTAAAPARWRRPRDRPWAGRGHRCTREPAPRSRQASSARPACHAATQARAVSLRFSANGRLRTAALTTLSQAARQPASTLAYAGAAPPTPPSLPCPLPPSHRRPRRLDG